MSTNLPVEANASGNAPIAPKVLAGTLGAGVGGALGSAIVWAIGIACPGGSFDATTVDKTIAACPSPIAQLIPIIVAGLGALYAGYKAPHQQRLEDVTAAIAKYVVGADETAPAAHDPVPVDVTGSPPTVDPGDPGNDGETVNDGDVSADPVAALGAAVPPADPPAQPAAPAAPVQ